MASHDLECPYEVIGCPFKDVVYAYTSPRGTMDDHKASSCGCHLDLAMVLLRNLDLKATSCKDYLVQAKATARSQYHQIKVAVRGKTGTILCSDSVCC